MTLTSLRTGFLVTGLFFGLGIQACGGAPESTPLPLQTPVAVTVVAAWSSQSDRAFPARVEAAREAGVATRASGVIREMPVDVGDRVRAGQVVVLLDGADVSARIRGAEAQVALAELTHGRLDRLAAQGAASRQELDQATATLAAARAALAEAQAQAGYVEVTAPFAGLVSGRMADPGDLAVPGRPVLRIQGDGAAVVAADLPADAAGLVAVGTSIRVSAAGTEAAGTLTRVVPALDAMSHRFRVEARLDEAVTWRPGTSVTLHVSVTGDGSQWIPESAVVRRGQLTGVFTVEADTLRLRWLRLGRAVGGAVEVLAGPVGLLDVVVEPGPDVADGRPVARVTREDVR